MDVNVHHRDNIEVKAGLLIRFVFKCVCVCVCVCVFDIMTCTHATQICCSCFSASSTN